MPAISLLTPVESLNATVTCTSSPDGSKFKTIPSPKLVCFTLSPVLKDSFECGAMILLTTLRLLTGTTSFPCRCFEPGSLIRSVEGSLRDDDLGEWLATDREGLEDCVLLLTGGLIKGLILLS